MVPFCNGVVALPSTATGIECRRLKFAIITCNVSAAYKDCHLQLQILYRKNLSVLVMCCTLCTAIILAVIQAIGQTRRENKYIHN